MTLYYPVQDKTSTRPVNTQNYYTKIKAVVGGTAGPAMAVPLFWPKMVLAGPLFRPIMIFFFAG